MLDKLYKQDLIFRKIIQQQLAKENVEKLLSRRKIVLILIELSYELIVAIQKNKKISEQLSKVTEDLIKIQKKTKRYIRQQQRKRQRTSTNL
jgi:NTP pyrophosphatase (non-canonical NTP hydrolase)